MANSLSLVSFDSNSYSVPVKHAHRPITIVATVVKVQLIEGDQLVARHERSWKREQNLFDPVHCLVLLEKEPGSFDHAPPLEHCELPDCFARSAGLESEPGGLGTREFIRVAADLGERQSAEHLGERLLVVAAP
jgi:hypothetical protein